MSTSNATPGVHWSLAVVPVQEWIGEARRSRDLLAGSAILSWLVARLLRRLGGEPEWGCEILLPGLSDADLAIYSGPLGEVLGRDRLAYGIPNRASGTLALPLDRAEELLGSLEAELAAGWEALRDEVGRSAARSARELWRVAGSEVARAACPFQVVWCVAAGEGIDLEAVDRLFAGVKRARRIVPHRDGAPVPKCGQCGRRESAGGTDPAAWRRFQDRLESLPEVERGLRIAAAESLCPVCMTKRFAGYLAREGFPSTSAVAARQWLDAVSSIDDLRSLVQAHHDAAGRVPGFDPRWADRAPLLFRRSILRELRAARERDEAAAVRALEGVERAHGELATAIESANRAGLEPPLPGQPPEYVAVVVFDGDDMGRRVRERPEVLPARVSAFQRRLAERVERSGASADGRALGAAQPFYLGGDEGLLLAPAARVLELCAELQELWQEAMAEVPGAAADAQGNGEPPTLSIGVALFDRERPLGPAIATARAALRQAKELPGKNGLGVACVSASGSRWRAVRPWGTDWQWARRAAAELRSGRLARGWPHDVERFLRSLPGEAWAAAESAPAAIREEVKRLTFRRAVGDGGGTGRREQGEAVWRRLGGDGWWPEVPPAGDRAEIAEQLHVVAFLQRVAEGGRDAA